MFAWLFAFLCFLAVCAYIFYGPDSVKDYNDIPTGEKNQELLQMGMKSNKGLFFVTSYTADGKVDKQILCSHVRENEDLKEFVCEEYETGDFYLFYYPVSVTNVTFAKDYIRFTNTK